MSNCNEAQAKNDTAYLSRVIDVIGTKFSKSFTGLLRFLMLGKNACITFAEISKTFHALGESQINELATPMKEDKRPA